MKHEQMIMKRAVGISPVFFQYLCSQKTNNTILKYEKTVYAFIVCSSRFTFR